MMIAGRDHLQGLAIGSVVGGSPRQAIYQDGVARWYALRVAPQREEHVEAWLADRGVYSFFPVTWHRMRVWGELKPYYRRYLAGLIFTRFKGDPLLDRVLACPWITGAICRADQQWGILDPRGLRPLHAMRRVDVDAKVAAATKAADSRNDNQLGQGSRAMFRSGPLAGFECEVVTLEAAGGIKVIFQLFGRESLLSASTSDLVALKK